MEFFTNPWVIGIGTAIAAALILYFVFGIGRPKSRRPQQTIQQTSQQTVQTTIQQIFPSTAQPTTTIQHNNHPTLPSLPSQEARSDITPQDIMDYLDSLPPLQKDSAAEHYKGINVSWVVNLRSGHDLENGKLGLMMGIEGALRPWVFCEVDPNQYPLLRVIKKTQSFRVDGEIKEVTGGDIHLKNCRLSF